MKKKNILEAISDIEEILNAEDSALTEQNKASLTTIKRGLEEAITNTDEIIINPETINQALQFMLLLWEIMKQ